MTDGWTAGWHGCPDCIPYDGRLSLAERMRYHGYARRCGIYRTCHDGHHRTAEEALLCAKRLAARLNREPSA